MSESSTLVDVEVASASVADTPMLAGLAQAVASALAPLLAKLLADLIGDGGRRASGRAEDVPALLSYREAAERYGVSDARLRRAVAAHDLPAIRLGPSSVRLEPAAVEAWLRSHRVGMTDRRGGR